MTANEPQSSLDDLREILRPHLESSQLIRDLAKVIGRMLLEECERVQDSENESLNKHSSSSALLERVTGKVLVPTDLNNAGSFEVSTTVPLKIGDASADVEISPNAAEFEHIRVPTLSISRKSNGSANPVELYTAEVDALGLDLELVARRCRLKAESCSVFVNDRVNADPYESDKTSSRKRDLIAQAKRMPDCFLWVFWRNKSQPDDEVLLQIADCYQALAAAVTLVSFAQEAGVDGEDESSTMQLLAEANSALRVALEQTWLNSPDVDQHLVYRWMCNEAKRRDMFLPRYMTLDDPADPRLARHLVTRIEEQRNGLLRVSNRRREIEEEFLKLKYHLGQLLCDDGSYYEHHVEINTRTKKLCRLGVPETDRRFREAFHQNILPALTCQYLDPPASNVVVNAQRDRDSGCRATNIETGLPKWSEQVRSLRPVLRGQKIVIVGGRRLVHAEQRVREAFGVEVVWVSLAEHGSGHAMKDRISQSDTALVLLLVKLVGHVHMLEAKRYAKDAGKPCVVLKAGYNPEQIAEAIIQQASKQLADAS